MDRSIFSVSLGICIAAHLIRTAYEILKHRKIIKANRITFAVILPTMVALWASWMSACEADIMPMSVPAVLRYAGLCLCLIGVIIFFIALFTIKALESYEGALITTGIYSFLRHPMYFSFILWLFGFPIFFGGGVMLLAAIPLAANVLLWRYFEEVELGHRFPEYTAYKTKTFF